ncbi:MAG TPA: DNA polymerase III subunit [Gemmatimonadaceae bacterium]|nr:DNA polymerase III subunit [Gemmatimonadaceae bacterium]
MPIVALHGHDALRQRLEAAIARGTLPASLLLHGPRGVGKQRIALWLAQRLLCDSPGARPCGTCQHCRFAAELTHPDLHWRFPRPRLKDGDASPDEIRADYADAIAERVAAHGLYEAPGGDEGIFIATVRAVVHDAALSPAMARRKVFVIGDAERMVPQEGSEQAANAFLKLLEEPPENTNIILTTSEPGALLPTIRSRVAAVRVTALPDADVRAFLAEPAVQEQLRKRAVPASTDERLQLAGGAPGNLFAQAAWDDALQRAHRMLDAVTRGTRAERMRVAFVQGSSKARGSFAEALEALAVLLRDRAKDAIQRDDEAAALGAARAVAAVEAAKEQASGNANPQLVTATLLRRLEEALR